MKLKSLTITLQPSYCDNAGKYIAEIEYEGEGGLVKTVLDPGVSETLLGFVGPVIVEFSRRAALEIARNVQFSVEEAKKAPTIEVQPDDDDEQI